MTPLTSLHLKNFQTYERYVLELDSHVTTLLGPSDVGKSSLLRALRWVCLNRPQGTSFLRHGESLCRASLFIGEQQISRKRGRSNSYRLDDKEFSAFGNEVPEEIRNLLLVDEDNFQRQHDAPYWFALSAGQVSKELNSVVNLEIIDRSLGNAATRLRSLKTEKQIREKEVAQAQDRKKSLDHVPAMHKELVRLEEQQKSIASKASSLAYKRTLLEKHTKARLAAQDAAQASLGVAKLGLAADALRSLEIKAEKLRSLRAKAKKLQRSTPPPSLTELESLHSQVEVLRKKRNRLVDLVGSAESHQENSLKWSRQISALERKLEAETAGRCPVCGKALPPSSS